MSQLTKQADFIKKTQKNKISVFWLPYFGNKTLYLHKNKMK